ncbi:MAG: c-type cytochrome [Planctomycetota bacterium]
MAAFLSSPGASNQYSWRKAVCVIWLAVVVASAAGLAVFDAEVAPDPEVGRAYLLHGDYIGAGIPIGLWRDLHAGLPVPGPALPRPGVDPSVPWDMNQYVTPEGVEVVSGVNCIGCHASPFMGGLVIGMGNSFADWTMSGGDMTPLKIVGGLKYPPGSDEATVLKRFFRGADVLEGTTATPFRGVVPAFRLEELAAAHRDPKTLGWSDERVFDPSPAIVASDVPAWWGLHKKSSIYFNGMGQGDAARLIQQIGIVMMDDKTDALRVLPRMRDVLAYIKTLEPPEYPAPIDPKLVARGAEVFAASCVSCHGTYGPGDAWTYPNKRVPVEEVGTDPHYARAIATSGLVDWYNRSWFASDGATYADATESYVAPPLDGVWSTAPYLHNGSVPDLASLLNSFERPVRWRRSFQDDDYDLGRVGWRFETVGPDTETGPEVYDTTVEGYGNQGHTYGDGLSEEDRWALIEYLKTL